MRDQRAENRLAAPRYRISQVAPCKNLPGLLHCSCNQGLERHVDGRKYRMRLIAGTAIVVCALFFIWSRKTQRQTSASLPPPITQTVIAEAAHSFPLAPSLPSANASARTKPAKTVEICGIGKVSLDEADDRPRKEWEARIAKDTSRWQAALLNSGDVRARAAGLLLEGVGGLNFGPPNEQALGSLIELAQAAHDPSVYALALSVCGTPRWAAATDRCQQLSPAEWTKLDPVNASAWLEQASAAHVLRDTAGENAAYTEAAKATKIDAYNWSLLSFAEPEIPSNITAVEQWEISIRMIGLEAGMVSPSITSRRCSSENIKDETVRGQCVQLAELLVSKGTTILDLVIGTSIGARVGWPEARISALKEEKEALMAAPVQFEPNQSENSWSCDAAAGRIYYLHQVAQLGEIAADREILSQSGQTRAQLAQNYRDYLERLMHMSEQQQLRSL
jgi:hypothetical protein